MRVGRPFSATNLSDYINSQMICGDYLIFLKSIESSPVALLFIIGRQKYFFLLCFPRAHKYSNPL